MPESIERQECPECGALLGERHSVDCDETCPYVVEEETVTVRYVRERQPLVVRTIDRVDGPLGGKSVVVTDQPVPVTDEMVDELIATLHEADGYLSLIGYRHPGTLGQELAGELVNASTRCRRLVKQIEALKRGQG